MTDEPSHPQPVELWKGLTEQQKIQAAEAFWGDADGIEQQAEALVLLAQRLKARPKFVQRLPLDRKARHLAHYPGMPDLLAARLLVSYHLALQRPMMAAFLDAAGVAHEDGLISEDPAGPIDAGRLESAVRALKADYPADAVSLYFATLLAQDPEIWAGLATHLGP
jgi:hypothetical protein